MMKLKSIEANTVRNVVGKAFIRVVKNHNYYGLFVNSFNKLKNYNGSERNPFGSFKDFDTLMKGIENFSLKTMLDERRFPSSGNDVYDKITVMINHMLHFFLEQNGVDSRRMGMYGQEIFDIACYTLFGDKYLEDMDKLNNSAPKPTNDMEAYLIAEYMKMVSSGKNISWDNFISRYRDKISMDMFDESTYRDNTRQEMNDDEYQPF